MKGELQFFLYRYKAVIISSFFFRNNPKTLDPSYKTDLDFGMVKEG